jgi:hypothetical protein
LSTALQKKCHCFIKTQKLQIKVVPPEILHSLKIKPYKSQSSPTKGEHWRQSLFKIDLNGHIMVLQLRVSIQTIYIQKLAQNLKV